MYVITVESAVAVNTRATNLVDVLLRQRVWMFPIRIRIVERDSADAVRSASTEAPRAV